MQLVHRVSRTGAEGRSRRADLAQSATRRATRVADSAPCSGREETKPGPIRSGRITWACFLAAALTILLADRACPGDTLDALVVSSAVADLATTEWALSKPGLREVNPLLQGPAHRALFKAAGTVAVVGGSRYLERRGHRGWSRGIRIGVVVLWGGLAVHNAIRARGAR